MRTLESKLFLLKHLFLLCISIFIFSSFLNATKDSLILNKKSLPINLKPFFGILEQRDSTIYSPEVLLSNPQLFQPLKHFKPLKYNHSFWLLTTIHSTDIYNAVLSFKYLTYADIYIIPDTIGATYQAHHSGSFQPQKNILPEDGRFFCQLNLTPGITYKLLIRSHHTKQYQPIFDFTLNNHYQFFNSKQRNEITDYWFQGGLFLLLLYVFINWLTTGYRPYIWLILCISGFYLYNLCLSRFMIDWFFPNQPITGWRLTIHFLHIGMIGLYLLILDFWKIKEKNALLYKLGIGIIYGIIAISITSFCINYFFSNFKLTTYLNISTSIVQFAYLLSLIKLWRTLNKHELFLAYGIVIYMILALILNIGILIAGEAILKIVPILSSILLITISLLFFAGINGQLWQIKKDKNLYLTQLTQLQQKQKQLLEENVAERTQELNERNKYIELLIHELNHRVKNNLQLLYSLNTLQLAVNKEVHASNILKDNIARIKAMILVNDRLDPKNNIDKKHITLSNFIAEIVDHSKKMFSLQNPINIKINIPNDFTLEANASLCIGIIVSELITNSYKHAFSENNKPQIVITVSNYSTYWVMEYQDNGPGYKEESTNGFGVNLIADLARQLKAQLNIQHQNGVHYFFTFANFV